MAEHTVLAVTALFQDGSRSTYNMKPDDTTQDLVTAITSSRDLQMSEDQSLRLIAMGKILQPSDKLKQYAYTNELVVQCSIRKERQETEGSQTEIVTGFDRLTRIGYTAEQIRELRRVFHSIHNTENSTQTEQLELEDEWVPAITLDGTAVTRMLQGSTELLSESFRFTPVSHTNTRNEDEAPLLAQEEAPHPTGIMAWVPFFVGVVIGRTMGIKAAIISVFFVHTFDIGDFLIGVIFGWAIKALPSS